VIEIRTVSIAKALLCSAFVVLSFMPAMALAEDPSVSSWLMRLHEASRHRTYTGTFVVSAGTQMASAKIWHVCDGDQQMERIESLSGTPRPTFRKNSEVLTLYPTAKVGIAETRDSFGLFPGLLKSPKCRSG